jgi:hypothetical protein
VFLMPGFRINKLAKKCCFRRFLSRRDATLQLCGKITNIMLDKKVDGNMFWHDFRPKFTPHQVSHAIGGKWVEIPCKKDEEILT